MYQSRPYGLHVIGGNLTDNDTARISNAAVRFTNLKQVSKIENLKLVYDLPDGGSFIVQDMGGNFRVIAHKPQYEKAIRTEGVAQDYMPMLFSGAPAPNIILGEGRPLGVTITMQTRQRLMGYTGELAPRQLMLQRFACRYNRKFLEFAPQNLPERIKAIQYGHQRPTWYTGAMAEVMQIVGGYGVQDLSQLPDDPIEQAKFIINDEYLSRIRAEIDGQRLPAYTGLPHKNGSFEYDYKHSHTNIIGFDELSNPWLLKIDNTGVWSMPMPIIPATKTKAFREYIESVGDTEILKILDRFGAMPSGETFPEYVSEFQAWRRAGVIIKVCDTADFYQHSAYSSAMGWAMNDAGDEAVNTCYDYDTDKGLFYGLAYKLRLRLGVATDNGWAGTNYKENETPTAQVSEYLSNLYQLLTDNLGKEKAIKYKISKSSLSFIEERIKNTVDENEVNFWHNLELDPIAIHTGNVVEISRGYIYNGHIIKVPEPFLEGCSSLGFNYALPPSREIKSDVIVLAYYIGNELKVVKSFNDQRSVKPISKNNFEKHMIVGKWEGFESYGSTGLQGDVYMTDVDDREPISLVERTTTIEGKDLGYGKPSFRFAYYFSKRALMWRNRYYTTKTNVDESNRVSLNTAALMPYYTRSVVIYAKIREAMTTYSSERFVLNVITDPNQYILWTLLYNENPNLKPAPDEYGPTLGQPVPVKGRPIWADHKRYEPSSNSDFADEGWWLGDLPYDVTEIMYGGTNILWALEIVDPPPPVATYFKDNYTDKVIEGELRCSIYSRLDLVRADEPSYWYFFKSPDNYNMVFYVDACKIVFGDTLYANISEEKPSGGRKRWGHTELVNHTMSHQFIGVINE